MTVDAVHAVRTARIVRTRNRIDQQRIHTRASDSTAISISVSHWGTDSSRVPIYSSMNCPIDRSTASCTPPWKSPARRIEHIGLLNSLQCRSFVGIGNRGKGILEATGYPAAYRHGIRHHDIELRHHGLPTARSESQSGKNKKRRITRFIRIRNILNKI